MHLYGVCTRVHLCLCVRARERETSGPTASSVIEM